jgi:hypothetical protein
MTFLVCLPSVLIRSIAWVRVFIFEPESLLLTLNVEIQGLAHFRCGHPCVIQGRAHIELARSAHDELDTCLATVCDEISSRYKTALITRQKKDDVGLLVCSTHALEWNRCG